MVLQAVLIVLPMCWALLTNAACNATGMPPRRLPLMSPATPPQAPLSSKWQLLESPGVERIPREK